MSSSKAENIKGDYQDYILVLESESHLKTVYE